LILPPKVAKIQVMIIPVGITAQTSDEEKAKLLNTCKEFVEKLKKADVQADTDLRDNYSPGWKHNHWELKGIPIRIELGPKELQANLFVAVRRDTMEKLTLKSSDLCDEIKRLLDDVHRTLFNRAKAELDSHMIPVDDWAEFRRKLDEKCIIEAPFCGDGECEENIKKDTREEQKDEPKAEQSQEGQGLQTAMGAKSLCIPFKPLKKLVDGQKCVHPKCGKKAQYRCLFGRSY